MEYIVFFLFSSFFIVQWQISLCGCCIVICWFRQKYTYIYWINTDASRTQKGKRRNEGRMKTSLEKYSPLTLLQGFEKVACERMPETERKRHILTPLLWPSRCVFIVLLMLGSTPSGLSEGPLGLVWPSLPHLVSRCLEFYWQLLGGFSECPLSRVWPSLPHLVSIVWNSAGNCFRGFPSAPSVGCGLPYHISSLTLGSLLATALATQTQLS